MIKNQPKKLTSKNLLSLKSLFKLVIPLVFFVVFTFLSFSPALNYVAAQNSAPDVNREGALFTWRINLTPDQIHDLQFLLDDEVVFSSYQPPDAAIATYSYDPANSEYSLHYYPLLDPGHHSWQIRIVDINNDVIAANQAQAFDIAEVDPNEVVEEEGSLATALNDYQVFMSETMIGDQSLANVSQSSLRTLSAVSAIIYGLVFLVQISYVLPMGILAQLLKALGFFRAGEEPRGYVFDSKTYEPVPFAVITIDRLSQNPNEPKFQETIVSGVDGIYRGVNLPVGTYRLQVQKDGFQFPSLNKRANFLNPLDYYQGEIFQVTNDQITQQMLIPLDINFATNGTITIDSASGSVSHKHRRRNLWQSFARFLTNLIDKLLIIFWILSILVVLAVPNNFLNWAIFIVYTLIMLNGFFKLTKRPRIKGVVTDKFGQPISDAMVRLSKVETNQLVAVSQTDLKGRYAFYVKKGVYQVAAYHQRYVVQSESTFALNEIDATRKRITYNILMQLIAEAGEFFSAPTSSPTETETAAPSVAENSTSEPSIFTSPTPEIVSISQPGSNQNNNESIAVESQSKSTITNINSSPPIDQIPDFNHTLATDIALENQEEDNQTSPATPIITPKPSSENPTSFQPAVSDRQNERDSFKSDDKPNSNQNQWPDVGSILKSQFK